MFHNNIKLFFFPLTLTRFALWSVSLDFLFPALLGGGVGGVGLPAEPPTPVVEAEGPAGDLGLALVGPPLRRYCSSTV